MGVLITFKIFATFFCNNSLNQQGQLIRAVSDLCATEVAPPAHLGVRLKDLMLIDSAEQLRPMKLSEGLRVDLQIIDGLLNRLIQGVLRNNPLISKLRGDCRCQAAACAMPLLH